MGARPISGDPIGNKKGPARGPSDRPLGTRGPRPGLAARTAVAVAQPPARADDTAGRRVGSTCTFVATRLPGRCDRLAQTVEDPMKSSVLTPSHWRLAPPAAFAATALELDAAAAADVGRKSSNGGGIFTATPNSQIAKRTSAKVAE